MPKFKTLLLIVGLWFGLPFSPLWAQLASPALAGKAQEFKILTEVHAADSTEPISSNVTLFSDNFVYDFRFSPGHETPLETTIFAPDSQTFELLDATRRVRLSIDKLELRQIAEGMREELMRNSATRFLAFEECSTEAPAKTNRVVVSNNRITYVAQGSRLADATVVRQYHVFLENYTLLSSSDPVQLPPFARMRLNQTLTRLDMVPEKITRTIRYEEHSETLHRATSDHRLVLELNAKDRKLIELAKQNLTEFRQIDLAAYRQLPEENSSLISGK